LSRKPVFSESHAEPVNAGLWRRVYSRLGPYWKAVVLAVILVSVAAATQPTLAVIMKPLLDNGFSGEHPHYVWAIPLAVISLIFLRGLASYFSAYLFAWVANNMLLGLRRDMFERLLGLSDANFRRAETGRLLNRFTVDAGNVTNLATEVITVLLRESLVVVALVAVLLYMSWQLTLIVIVMLPASAIIAQYFIRRLRRINRDTISMNAELTRVVREAIDGQREIKLFDGFGRERERFHYVNRRLRRFAMRAAIADAALSPLAQFTVALSVGTVIGVALYQANTSALTVGSFGAFMAALGQIFDPIRRLTKVAGSTQKMLTSAESVFALIDEASEPDDGRRTLPQPVRGHVRFDRVSQRYPDAHADTVREVSFEALPGQTVALVGHSGSGKTTLANMLPRFVVPDSGHIMIDGVDVRELRLSDLRSHLSLVSQNVVLFEGSIADNVAYGVHNGAHAAVSEETLRGALEAANLLEFVDGLPQGLDTPVGRDGSQLSGGQRQRLAIARALVKNAPILILDEATSALDNVSERQVQASLETLMKGRTTLVIAHRLSTVQKADVILVLDQGRIVEQGDHETLLAHNGRYAALYRMQFETT